MSIVLCRHATTSANREGRFLSRTDLPLDENGRLECERLRETLRSQPVDRCFVSPMKRCLETLELARPGTPAVVRDELREVDFGEWEMLAADDVLRRWPEQAAQREDDPAHFRPPGGESFSDAALRLAPMLEELREGNVLVVSHRGTLGVLERLLRGLALDYRDVAPIEPAGVRVISSSAVPRHAAPSDVSNTSLQ